MKVSINCPCNDSLFNMSDVKKKVICNDIPMEVFEDDIKRRVAYIVAHKYERCMDRLKKEWMPKLKAAGVESIPMDDDAFAAMVFARPEYKCRSTRERAARPEFDAEVPQVKAQVQAQLNAHVDVLK